MEIYRQEGTLIASSGESPNHDRVGLHRFIDSIYQFGRGIREGEGSQPDFDEEASDQSREVAVR